MTSWSLFPRLYLDRLRALENIWIKVSTLNFSLVPSLLPDAGPKSGGFVGVQLDVPGVGMEGFAAGADLDVGGK